MKRALIVGFSGQDGSYLVEHLTAREYIVAGIGRGTVLGALPGGSPVDIRDSCAVRRVVAAFAPDEAYYLAGFHHASESFPVSEYDLVQRSFEINTLALDNFLRAIASRVPSFPIVLCRLISRFWRARGSRSGREYSSRSSLPVRNFKSRRCASLPLLSSSAQRIFECRNPL